LNPEDLMVEASLRMAILTKLTQAFSDAMTEHKANKEEVLNAAIVFVAMAYANVIEENPALYSELRKVVDASVRSKFDWVDQAAAAACLDS
jgi:hypothetical protein